MLFLEQKRIILFRAGRKFFLKGGSRAGFRRKPAATQSVAGNANALPPASAGLKYQLNKHYNLSGASPQTLCSHLL